MAGPLRPPSAGEIAAAQSARVAQGLPPVPAALAKAKTIVEPLDPPGPEKLEEAGGDARGAPQPS